jgi:(p)ppGpp synthase/HD superfamily hydrolase
MFLSNRFASALTWAFQLHQQQVRKGSGVPYISHLLGVASIALEYGADEDEAIAALLHDAIEDQGGVETKEEIRRRFGEKVTAIVNSCTDSETIPKPPWRERKEAYLQHLSQADASVLLVATADKLYNARSILKDYHLLGDEIWQRFHGKKEGTIWYYQSLVKVLQSSNSTPLIQELINEFTQVVTEIEKLIGSSVDTMVN